MSSSPEAADSSKRRILVVDDEPHIGRIIQLKLENDDYEVRLVGDGQQAMDVLEGDDEIDLVLLDIMMPYLSGFDVLKEVKKIPHREGMPFIVLTAKGQDSDRTKALELGAIDFFTKPFSPNKLLGRINEILD